MRTKRILWCIKQLYIRFYEDEVTALGAQLAYNLILSFFPFLIFLLTLLGYSPISGTDMIKLLDVLLPENAFVLIRNTIFEIMENRDARLLSFSFATSLWLSSNGLGAVIHGLNKAYDCRENRSIWKIRTIALLFTILLSFTIIFSFILLVLGGVIERRLVMVFGLPALFHLLWNIIRYAGMLVIMMFTFASIYLYMPCRRLGCRKVIPGAVFSTIGWILISTGFAYYIDNFGDFSYTYGSIGGVMVLLVWLFLSAVIILTGGELNAVLALDRDKIKLPPQ